MQPYEWLKQSDYDFETAEFMFSGRRFFYAVFMCHLAIEKALKGVYQKQCHDLPPKTHNLIFLMTRTDKKPEDRVGKFITKINEASVATRYPEDIDKMHNIYTKEKTEQILLETKEVLTWIKSLF